MHIIVLVGAIALVAGLVSLCIGVSDMIEFEKNSDAGDDSAADDCTADEYANDCTANEYTNECTADSDLEHMHAAILSSIVIDGQDESKEHDFLIVEP